MSSTTNHFLLAVFFKFLFFSIPTFSVCSTIPPLNKDNRITQAPSSYFQILTHLSYSNLIPSQHASGHLQIYMNTISLSSTHHHSALLCNQYLSSQAMETKTIPNPVSPISLVGFVGFLIFLRVLNWAFRIPKFYSSFQFLLQSHLNLVFGENSDVQSEKKNSNPERLDKQLILDGKVDDEKLHRGEVEMVMEKLGICCDPDGDKLQEKMGLDEFLNLFEENDPTLEEVKEAFEVFDENRDGYIDAEELQRVLCALGFVEGSELRDCKRMIGAFDTNGDGRIDFTEFVKYLEISFC